MANPGHVPDEDDPPSTGAEGMCSTCNSLTVQIKIGRQTNNKTVPGERNAYFDSKVLSRTHAEIWEQNGKVRDMMAPADEAKIYIKDVKSSNGTFINGVRLSPEGVESDPYELKSEDMVVSLGLQCRSQC